MPSSTCNKQPKKLHIHNSLADSNQKHGSSIFQNKNVTQSYGAIGVNNGPIKIKMHTGMSQKSS